MNIVKKNVVVNKLMLTFSLLLLAGCGVEVASTALTAAQLQATQVEQAKAQEAQFQKKLEEAMQATEAATAARSKAADSQ